MPLLLELSLKFLSFSLHPLCFACPLGFSSLLTSLPGSHFTLIFLRLHLLLTQLLRVSSLLGIELLPPLLAEFLDLLQKSALFPFELSIVKFRPVCDVLVPPPSLQPFRTLTSQTASLSGRLKAKSAFWRSQAVTCGLPPRHRLRLCKPWNLSLTIGPRNCHLARVGVAALHPRVDRLNPKRWSLKRHLSSNWVRTTSRNMLMLDKALPCILGFRMLCKYMIPLSFLPFSALSLSQSSNLSSIMSSLSRLSSKPGVSTRIKL